MNAVTLRSLLLMAAWAALLSVVLVFTGCDPNAEEYIPTVRIEESTVGPTFTVECVVRDGDAS